MPKVRDGQSATNSAIERLAKRLSSQAQPGDRMYERDFAGLLTLLSPRIARLIRQYRLGDMPDDAEQAAAIGVHRALASFDPAKAGFGTHATWQIRGELQSLRHRMRPDQRQGARAAGVRMISFEEARAPGCRAESVFEVADETALDRTERGASDSMTRKLAERLMAELESPLEERGIFIDHVFGKAQGVHAVVHKTPEQRRQIVRRTARNCAKALAA